MKHIAELKNTMSTGRLGFIRYARRRRRREVDPNIRLGVNDQKVAGCRLNAVLGLLRCVIRKNTWRNFPNRFLLLMWKTNADICLRNHQLKNQKVVSVYQQSKKL